MKYLNYATLTVLVLSSVAYCDSSNVSDTANGSVIANCASDDGSVSLDLVRLSDGAIRAHVTVESSGGGMPEFNYAVTQKQSAPGILGAPMRFVAQGFDLEIGATLARNANGTAPSRLVVSDIGVDSDLGCTLN